MDLDYVKQILDLVREHDLAEFELENGGMKVRIRKAGHDVTVLPAAAAPAALPTPVSAPPAFAPIASGAAPEAADPAELNLGVITSPIVGTFYRSPEPSASAFVEVGDVVKKGQVLCIIEAMKLMNEIESDRDGEIAAVYVENGKAVQFGERLFAVKLT